MSAPRSRSRAELISLGVSLVVLAIVLGVLLSGFGRNEAARPVANVTAVETEPDDTYRVTVDVTNEGDRAAAGVQISATLSTGTGEESGDQTIDFLGGGETRTLVFLFTEDPAAGELDIAVTSFAKP
jgi:uncharacterized protein (TIGR02588 family)